MKTIILHMRICFIVLLIGGISSCQKQAPDLANSSDKSNASIDAMGSNQSGSTLIELSNYWYKKIHKDSLLTRMGTDAASFTHRLDDTVTIYLSCNDDRLQEFISVKGGVLGLVDVPIFSRQISQFKHEHKIAHHNQPDSILIEEDRGMPEFRMNGDRKDLVFSAAKILIRVLPPTRGEIKGNPRPEPPIDTDILGAWCRLACCRACEIVHAEAGLSAVNCICCFYCDPEFGNYCHFSCF